MNFPALKGTISLAWGAAWCIPYLVFIVLSAGCMLVGTLDVQLTKQFLKENL
jgi:hypothetical protein